MAKTTKSKGTGKKTGNPTKEKIIQAYIDHVVSHGKKPVTVFKFCKEIGIKESEFYDVAGSFHELENQVWTSLMVRAIDAVSADQQFVNFSAREKMLALYFTLLEILKENRSFAVMTAGISLSPVQLPACLKGFKTAFESFVTEIIGSGKSSGEVAARPMLDNRYPQIFWIHLMLVLQFWVSDSSTSFEQSDAFVEKSVNLAFDLFGKGALDTAIDLAKFVYQNKVRF
ncbi:MAG: TetR/AcrR family transcriptional regulator [Bacteroidetes bacterium]|nr:TetR/AcrR family transcriptional regulator [Bacteroidota bacterium]